MRSVHTVDHPIGDDLGNDPAAQRRAEAATAEVLARRRPAKFMDFTVRWDFMMAIMADNELAPAAIKAAGVLLDCYNHHKGCAWPSVGTIAERINAKRPTASAAVNQLAERGWFRIETTRSDNRQGSNRYFPCIDRLKASVSEIERSDDLSVSTSDVQRQEKHDLSVSKNRVSESAKSNTNPSREPVNRTQEKNQASLPHAREGRPDLSSGGKDLDACDPVKVTLPEDYQFPADAVTAARARGLQDHDLVRALVGFRRIVGSDKRITSQWHTAGASYLAKAQPKPVHTEPAIQSAGRFVPPKTNKWGRPLGSLGISGAV